MSGLLAQQRRAPAALLAACALALLLCGGARAMPLTEYRARIAEADGALASLLTRYEAAQTDEQVATLQSLKPDEAELLRMTRASLPATERVEWAGNMLEVDNRWLLAALDDFEKLPPTPVAARLNALRHLAAYVHALADRLAEAATAATAAPRDKMAEKGRLHAILQRPEYNEEAARGGALEQLRQRFLRWLRSLLPESKPMQPKTAMNLSRLARVIIYTLSLLLIAFVIWRYGPRLLRRKLMRARKPEQARVILGERLGPDETPADLLSAAERLARMGDLRGAMRKGYIAVLCELGERKLLRLAPHKTNRDYLRALRDQAQLLRVVQPLTTAYERHWYGLAPATDADWSEFQTHCSSAVTSDK